MKFDAKKDGKSSYYFGYSQFIPDLKDMVSMRKFKMKKTIEGVLEDINKQLSEIRKTHNYKVVNDKKSVREVPGGKRIWLTIDLELEEK